MKRLLFALFLIPALLFCGCEDKYPQNDKDAERIAAEINKNTTLELGFLEYVSGKNLSYLVPDYGWFGASGYYNSGYQEGDIHYVQYLITAYPDCADSGSYVTRIECTDPAVTFFDGYTVNNSEELIEYLSNDGYEIDGNDLNTFVKAKKGRITISFFEGDGYNKVMFMYDVSNRTGMIF